MLLQMYQEPISVFPTLLLPPLLKHPYLTPGPPVYFSPWTQASFQAVLCTAVSMIFYKLTCHTQTSKNQSRFQQDQPNFSSLECNYKTTALCWLSLKLSSLNYLPWRRTDNICLYWAYHCKTAHRDLTSFSCVFALFLHVSLERIEQTGNKNMPNACWKTEGGTGRSQAHEWRDFIFQDHLVIFIVRTAGVQGVMASLCTQLRVQGERQSVRKFQHPPFLLTPSRARELADLSVKSLCTWIKPLCYATLVLFHYWKVCSCVEGGKLKMLGN